MTPRDKLLRSQQSTVQLMFNTHDPLTETHRAARAQEDDYFRKLEHELLVALRATSAAESEQTVRHSPQRHCPKCGAPLEAMPSPQATMAVCPRCGGIWLDTGTEAGRVGPKAPGWIQRLCEGLMASTHGRF
ncbi:MAG: zf-TFIIB domain-containing protein [Candidatus Tectimicrobiota bacterium]